jgi:hypothetical protein
VGAERVFRNGRVNLPLVKGEVVKTTPPQKTPPTPVYAGTVAATPQPRSPGAIKTAAEPAAPQVAPIKPPVEPPQPALANVGFHGGIQEFNQRVQQAHDTFTTIHGYDPPPGLVLDIARSPLMPEQFSPLLQPASQLATQHRAAISNINPAETLTIRHDGYTEQQHPVAAATIADKQRQYQSLQKQHPWVAMGMLPIDTSLANGFWDAVKYAQDNPTAAAPLAVGGETLEQYRRENLLGESLTGTRPGSNPGLVNQGYGKPASTTPLQNASDLYARESVGRGVTTVVQAQDKLKQIAPDFFTGADGKPLPSTGFVNSDWAKAIGKYQSSALYFRQQTVKLAHDNHFGDNTAAFTHAWQAKQAAIKKQPFLAVFLAHQPLAFFDHRIGGASVVNLLSGDTKGWGWTNIPTLELGGLVHLAGLGVNEIAGTVDQAKTDAAFVSAYMQSMQPQGVSFAPGGRGMTEKQARERAWKILRENPSWAKVIDPNYQDGQGPELAAKQLAPFANAAIDLSLGAPKFTGERILAGDIGAAKSSRYFSAKTEFAFNALKKGKLGEAVASLEGGTGAERLNALLEEAVKGGDVNLAQYQQHAHELYAHGNTTIRFRNPPKADAAVEPVAPTPPSSAPVGTLDEQIAKAERDAEIARNHLKGQWKSSDTTADSYAQARNELRAAKDKIDELKRAPWYGKKPGEEFTFKGGDNKEQTGFLDPKGIPRNADGTELFSKWHLYPVEKLVPAIKKELATGQYEYTGPLSQRDLTDLYPEDSSASAPSFTEHTINGPLFRSLRTKDLPTPAKVLGAAQTVRAKLNSIGDQFEQTLRARKQEGATSHAANFVASVRQLTARTSPGGSTRSIFSDERLPEDVYNWARVELKAAPDKAAALRDEIIRIRASNDVQAAADFSDKLRSEFMVAHPKAVLGSNPMESAGPELESESRTYLTFPKAVEGRAQAINDKLNAFGRTHRQTIVSGSPIFGAPIPGGGESLAYKHAIADTTRRVIGGGGIFPVEKEARKLVDDYLKANPTAIRDVGVARESAEMGENRYITGKKPTDPLTFRTGDSELVSKGDKVKRSAALKAAGGYLRRNLTSDAMQAYQASTKDNLQPLVELVMRDKFYRSQLDKIVAKAQETNPLAHLNDSATLVDKAHAYAETIFTRYKEIEEAGQAAGRTDPLNEALDVLIKNKGAHADEALGHWIDEHKIDMPVRDGMVERSSWDDVTQWWIGKLMTANKWNRRTLFDHVFYGTTHDLVNHGWTVEDALPVAADLAKRQTIYHMLDFSNMLQAEQNLRWLSYFATKHRLYWSWILKQAARRPGLAVAVNDASQHLDAQGNLNMAMFGREFQIPAARLFWVNAKEYPQTSTMVQFLAEAGKGAVEGHGLQAIPDAFGTLTSTSGNLFTRDDQAEMMGVKLALVAAGKIAATSDAVTIGMSATQKRQFQMAVNQYSAFYKADHGVWPSETDAVKHALLGATAQEAWRSNLPLPVTWNDPSTPTTGQKALIKEYGQISDPAKKRAFLDANPGIALLFGVSQDPMVYLHNNELWDKFNAAQKVVTAQRNQIWQDILKNGYTPQTKIAMKALSDAWSAKIDQLKMEDASSWPGSLQFPAGKVSDGRIVTPGPWGTVLEGDPLSARAFVHQSFPGIKPQEIDAKTVGANIVALQQEASVLRAAKTPAQIAALGYPDAQHVRDRVNQINQIIAPFFAYPKDASSKAQSAYYSQVVGPYITERDKKAAALNLAPEDQQDALRSQFRAWKDEHDHPVTLTVDGRKIKFPSVVQIGWATLPPDQRTLGLAQAVSGDWSHVASYEKTMLGVETPSKVSEGWAAFYSAVRDYSKNPTSGSLVAAQKTGLAKQIDKVYPGFYKDFLFAQQPKIERFKRTSLYQQLPDQTLFYRYIGQPAVELAKAIKANGNRSYYEKHWRNYVETDIVPWLDGQPDLKKALADYGPDFLNTLPSVSGP